MHAAAMPATMALANVEWTKYGMAKCGPVCLFAGRVGFPCCMYFCALLYVSLAGGGEED